MHLLQSGTDDDLHHSQTEWRLGLIVSHHLYGRCLKILNIRFNKATSQSREDLAVSIHSILSASTGAYDRLMAAES